MEISIEVIKQGEEHQVSQLIRSVYDKTIKSYYSKFGTMNFYETIDPQSLKNRNLKGSLIHKVMVNNRLAGVFELEWNHVKLLFIDEKFRGMGIGRQIIDWIKNFVVKNYIEHKLTVNSAPNSYEVYKKLGFKATGNEIKKKGIIYTPMELIIP